MNTPLGFSKLSIERKMQVLICLTAFVFFIAYIYNIQKTINIISSYYSLKGNIANIQDEDKKTKLRTQDKIASTQNTIDNISKLCTQNNVVINEILQYPISKTETYSIETNKILVSGKYNDILNTIWLVEQRKIATINSLQWQLLKLNGDKTPQLYANIYIKHASYESTK